MANEDKKRALDAAIAKLEKDFGKGTVMRLGDPSAQVAVETIPTGSLSLDLALGLGGVPKGRIVEIYGPESSGKTTVALHMIAEVQKRGGIAGFIDAEHALDPVYAKNIGVDIDELYISQPDSGDQALEITETMVRSGAMDIIVVDSVAALVPKQEIEGDMGDSHVGLQARLMSQALRKLTPVISKSNCVVIFINQLREKVGVMFGNPETTTGGRALKFYASVRMDIQTGQLTTSDTKADYPIPLAAPITITPTEATVATNYLLWPGEAPTFRFSISGHTYEVRPSQSFIAAKKQKYTFTIQAEDINVGASINPWTEGPGGSGEIGI